MIRVLHVYKSYYPVIGGLPGHLRILCTELAKDRDLNVEILVTNQNKSTVEIMEKGVRIIKVGKFIEFASTPISLSLSKWMKKLNPDIIHLHFPYPVAELSALLLESNRKIVLTYHSDIVKQKRLLFFYKPFLKKVLKRAQTIIASSPNYVLTSSFLTQFRQKVKVIPYGIDLSLFEKRDENEIKKIKEKFGTPLVLFVGVFRYYKGLHFLIEAAKNVEAKFLLIGSGGYRLRLEKQVERNNLHKKIFFLEGIGDGELPSFYHASDIFVLPSTYKSEAFGIVQLEAMVCGLPVVSTELGTGTSFVNLHQKSGLVVLPSDTKALASALNLLLSDSALRRKFGETGRKRVLEEFTKEKMTEKTKELYYQILNK